jgi:hypothetical protein
MLWQSFPMPAVMWIHGCAWSSGSYHEMRLMRKVARGKLRGEPDNSPVSKYIN